jgi:D-alanyl-D-alanine carboxypeptidase
MTASANMFKRHLGRLVPTAPFQQQPAKIAALALVAFAFLAHPAEARSRRGHSSYTPPQSAMVVDGNSGKILYANNPDEPRFPASITKVMTLYLLFERLRDGRIKMDTPLKVTANAASQAPSKLGLEPGSTISVRDAIYALVTKSANDCAVVIAENLAGSEEDFARQMTTRARSLGMTNTTFRNASGLPNPEQRTTARDLVTMGRHVLADFPDYARVFSTRSFTYAGESHRNHNSLLFTYRGMEGLKTGFTQASGFNLLTSARRDQRHLVAVVLGGSSAGARNARMRTLLNAAWEKAVDGSKALIAKAPARIREQPVEEEMASAALELPERNPAFHPSVSERAITLAMAAMLEADRQHSDASRVASTAAAVVPAVAVTTVARVKPASEAAEVQAKAALTTVAQKEAGRAEGADPAAEAQAELATAEEEASARDEVAQEQGDTAATAAPANALGPYHIQVGSYASVSGAQTWLQAVAGKAGTIVNGHGGLTVAGQVKGQSRYRARFGQFTEVQARSACGKLKALSIDCMVVRAE